MKLIDRLLGRSIESLVRLACILALFGLCALCVSVLYPKPLPVIFAMSGGQAIGILAFICYLLAVVLDARRSESGTVASTRTTTSDGETPQG